MSVAMAATKIQNLWKGAIARRQVKKQREEELAFIGMVSKVEVCVGSDFAKNRIRIRTREVRIRSESESKLSNPTDPIRLNSQSDPIRSELIRLNPKPSKS